jgi:hypothetical protein
LQSKSVTPSTVSQTITPDSPNIGLSSVIVGATSGGVKSIQTVNFGHSNEQIGGNVVNTYIPAESTYSLGTTINKDYAIVLINNNITAFNQPATLVNGQYQWLFGGILTDLTNSTIKFRGNASSYYWNEPSEGTYLTYVSYYTSQAQVIELFPAAVKKVYRGLSPAIGGTISIGGTVVPSKCMVILQTQTLERSMLLGGQYTFVDGRGALAGTISTTSFSIINSNTIYHPNSYVSWQLVEFN